MLRDLLNLLMAECGHAAWLGAIAGEQMISARWGDPRSGIETPVQWARKAAHVGLKAIATRERILAQYGEDAEQTVINTFVDAIMGPREGKE